MADRFISPCAPPTARQREVAEILIEECAEVQQRATKLLRFGVTEVQPGQPYDNRDRLSHEVGDLMCVIRLAIACGILTDVAVSEGDDHKEAQLARFMQTDADG